MVSQAAKQLGMQAVPVVVGFENRNGRNVPKLGGTLVLSRDVDIIRTAAFDKDFDRQAKANLKISKVKNELVFPNQCTLFLALLC